MLQNKLQERKHGKHAPFVVFMEIRTQLGRVRRLEVASIESDVAVLLAVLALFLDLLLDLGIILRFPSVYRLLEEEAITMTEGLWIQTPEIRFSSEMLLYRNG